MGAGPPTISRRQLLKRGGLAAAGALWITPVVQVVGMGRAYAQDTSPDCRIYCIEWQLKLGEDDGDRRFAGRENVWRSKVGTGGRDDDDDRPCLPCPADAVGGLPPEIDDFTVQYEAGFYVVTYPDSCSLVPAGDPTPDELVNGSAAIRCGDDDDGGCNYAKASDEMWDPEAGTRSIRLGPCFGDEDDDDEGVHIELVIKCCQSPA